ncbi:uncharacterized protein N0V89_001071 [Didymosphaeria variabile]|uniref:Uncharacterized protein n=1 Tax=Didymosphaeria variabile TaxID=1932322 RepID=A0A9W8XWH4_9PLEO|nr:uncharacterized protein N0V89_001071 [Didymosphaeria variabile]KAJ4360506.1 hypothetical protein N0V89_001071 [Didymosphaeria variabile]
MEDGRADVLRVNPEESYVEPNADQNDFVIRDHLEIRAGNEYPMTVQLGSNVQAVVWYLGYPQWRQYLDLALVHPSQILRRYWHFLTTECEDEDDLFDFIGHPSGLEATSWTVTRY